MATRKSLNGTCGLHICTGQCCSRKSNYCTSLVTLRGITYFLTPQLPPFFSPVSLTVSAFATWRLEWGAQNEDAEQGGQYQKLGYSWTICLAQSKEDGTALYPRCYGMFGVPAQCPPDAIYFPFWNQPNFIPLPPDTTCGCRYPRVGNNPPGRIMADLT